jgi:L-lactate dehydrogenase
MDNNTRKVVVVGAGAVGAAYCFALAQSGLADHIALIDKNTDLARGHVLDLRHGLPFLPSLTITAGSPNDYRDADLIVITAGAAQQPGQSRMHLLTQNAAIIRAIMADIQAHNSKAVIVIATNPVDVMAYAAIQTADELRGRIFGSGTVLDSARFRQMLSAHCGVDIQNVHAYILGEHGDSEFAAWSMTHIAGMPIDQYCPICGKCDDWQSQRASIQQTVRDSAYHIIDYKGATNWAIGLALVRITRAVLRDTRSVLTVSTLLEGEYGLNDVCLSVPCIVSAQGIQQVIVSQLPPDEHQALHHSADVLREAINLIMP